MVRYKKRYFVVELERPEFVAKGRQEPDLQPLNSRDLDIAEAIKEKVTELHGDFGRASITVGFKVIYANKDSRLVVMRCRHGPHTILTSSLPFLSHVRKEPVVCRLLYTGATVRHCHMFMVKRQTAVLKAVKAGLRAGGGRQGEEERMEERLMDIRQIDAF